MSPVNVSGTCFSATHTSELQSFSLTDATNCPTLLVRNPAAHSSLSLGFCWHDNDNDNDSVRCVAYAMTTYRPGVSAGP